MAVFAVYIEKTALWRGSTRVFGNTYHYRTDPGQLFTDEEVADWVATTESYFLASDVKISRVTTWGPTDQTEFDSVIRFSEARNIPGTVVLTKPMFREVGVLASWPLPRSPVTNRKRWLRKFYRSCPIDATITDAQLEGADPLTQDQRNTMWGHLQDIERAQSSTTGTVALCTSQGDLPTSYGYANEYLVTRQIGR